MQPRTCAKKSPLNSCGPERSNSRAQCRSEQASEVHSKQGAEIHGLGQTSAAGVWGRLGTDIYHVPERDFTPRVEPMTFLRERITEIITVLESDERSDETCLH